MKKEAFLKKFIEIIDSITVRDHSGFAQDKIENELKKQNWLVVREHKVPDRGDGKRGRVDLMVLPPGLRVGIEIDNWVPIKKSIFKLKNNDFDVRIILLRGTCEHTYMEIEGIDLVKVLNVE